MRPCRFLAPIPAPPSEAKDCRATFTGSSCSQNYDVGAFCAAGASDFGMGFIAIHPGFDMVIAVHPKLVAGVFEFGPEDLWAALRPGVIAMDPNYNGDEEAFCTDYGAGNYAPDLVAPRWRP